MSDLNEAEVVSVVLEEHPNADSLSIVRVWDGYTVCVRTSDWEGVDLGVYIPPDNIVPDTEAFSFLDNHRIKTRKFRGVMSQGLLTPIPEGIIAQLGDRLSEEMGITRYVSQQDSALSFSSNMATAPEFPGVKYDVESWFKYRNYFNEGEEVVITEKLHGTNARFTYQDGEFHVASRSFFRQPPDDGNDPCVYWRALRDNEWLKIFLIEHPGTIVYGEIFGWVQDLRYGKTPGVIDFKVFDVYNTPNRLSAIRGGHWSSWSSLEQLFSPPQLVPVLYKGPYSHEIVETFISGRSFIEGADHIREGVVIKPVNGRFNDKFDRLILKAVSPEYLSKVK